MSDELRSQAEELARTLNYTILIEEDRTTDTDSPIFLLTIRELPGCMAQGVTIPLALKELQEVEVDFIESLLEDGLTVPDDSPPTQTVSSVSYNPDTDTVNLYDDDAAPDFTVDLEKAGQPSHRRTVGEISQEVAI